MRILANYGYKDNGNTYSVTFETMGDVPKDRSDSTVDELFRLAKAAIQRQLMPATEPWDGPVKEKNEVTIPEPRRSDNSKPQPKDPTAPATTKQKSFIIRLAKERGQFIDGLHDFNIGEASQKIEELLAV